MTMVLALLNCAAPTEDDADAASPVASTPPGQVTGQPAAGLTDPETEMTIEEAQEALTEPVMALEGVVGIAIGECDGVPCIVVYLAAADDALEERIPEEYGGHPVRTEVTGEIRGPRPIG